MKHYQRRQQKHKHLFVKMLFIGAGLLILLSGVVLLPIPGPSIFMFFAGASLIAQESSVTARALDHIELRIRKVARWCRAKWHHASQTAKVLFVLTTLAAVGAVGVACV